MITLSPEVLAIKHIDFIIIIYIKFLDILPVSNGAVGKILHDKTAPAWVKVKIKTSLLFTTNKKESRMLTDNDCTQARSDVPQTSSRCISLSPVHPSQSSVAPTCSSFRRCPPDTQHVGAPKKAHTRYLLLFVVHFYFLFVFCEIPVRYFQFFMCIACTLICATYAN